VILRVTRKRYPVTDLSEWWMSMIEKSRRLNQRISKEDFRLTDTRFTWLNFRKVPEAEVNPDNLNDR